MKAARDSWVNPALALVLCGAAGAACAGLTIPLPWMIGPLLAMAASNFAGAGLRAPPAARSTGQVIIGTALGLYFTPAVAREVISHWHLLLVAGVLAILIGVLAGWMLGWIARTDRTTAFFASVPGGATEMTILGERFGARPDRVALAQSLRILVVVIVVPFALTYSGVHGTDAYLPSATPLQWRGLATLLGIAALSGLVLNRLRLPNAFMFGPLLVVTALTVSEFEFSSMPVILSNAAQLMIGWALGARFDGRSLESVPRYVGGVLASVAFAIVLAASFAFYLGWLTGLPIATLVLATAPGGIAEMCITAKVLQLGVPLVTAAHVSRVIVLIATTGPSYRAARAWSARVRNR